MIKLILPLALLTTLAACSEKKQDSTTSEAANPTPEMQWLVAKWENQTPDGLLSENWSRQDDSTLQGHSSMVKGADTLFHEIMTIERRNGKLHYIPTVKDQNGSQPVVFTLIDSTGGKWVFENKAHDFPQQVTYVKPSGDSLLAYISGMMEGTEKREEFRMVRVR